MKTEKLFDIITSAMKFGYNLPKLNNPPYCPICDQPEHHRDSELIKICPRCQGDLEFPFESELARKYSKN